MNRYLAEYRVYLEQADALRDALLEIDPADWLAVKDVEAKMHEAEREAERLYFDATGCFPPASYTEEQEYEALRQDVRGAGHPF